jgi:ribosomal-protein-alanine N-acetyltransferase
MRHPPELVSEIFVCTATEQGYASPGQVRLDTLAGMDNALTTERLALRPVTAADHPVLLAHWTLPDVRRFLFDGAALSAAEVSETIEESARDFAAGGYGIWLIRERGRADLAGTELIGTELIGTVGLRPLDDTGLEIFYSLAPGSWGRGYATEAARAVVGHALGTLGLAEVLAEVDEGNTASVAVVKRLGMVPYAVVPGELGPMTRYRTSAGTA